MNVISARLLSYSDVQHWIVTEETKDESIGVFASEVFFGVPCWSVNGTLYCQGNLRVEEGEDGTTAHIDA